MRHVLALAALALLLLVTASSVRAQLVLPDYTAPSPVYSHNCDRRCFGGSTTIYPEVSGSSNTYCTNPLGCDWHWHMEVAPCSGSLLAFEATVGLLDVPFSTIDPAVYRELRFVCTDSGDSGSILAVRTESWLQPLMQWTFLSTACSNLMGSGFNDSEALFENAFVNVKLSAQNWYSLMTTSLLDSELECEALPPKCERCFTGTQIVELPVNASASLIAACGLTPDAIAQSEDVFGECPVGWQFCIDVCRGEPWRTSDIDVILGGADLTSLGHLNQQAAKHLSIRLGTLNDGRTVLALTDAASVEALAAGSGASFYLAWIYTETDPAELMVAKRRDFLFQSLEFGLLTDDDELLRAADQVGPQNALGSFVWDGLSNTGIDALVRTARALNGREQGLVAGLVCVSVLATIFFLLFIYCWYRRYTEQNGDDFSYHQHQPHRTRQERKSKLVSKQDYEDAQKRQAARDKMSASEVPDDAKERAQQRQDAETDHKLMDDYRSQGFSRLAGSVAAAVSNVAGMATSVVHNFDDNEDEDED